MNLDAFRHQLSFLGSELYQKIKEHGIIREVEPNTEILREKEYVRYVPLVLSGLVRVAARFEDKEMLLYYIQPLESCVMSFSASRENTPSKVFAVTELKSVVLLLPSDKLVFWLHAHPVLHNIFYKEYDKRYGDLLNTLQQVIFQKMEDRLYDYLKTKQKAFADQPTEFSPTKIARELGTAREVISRVAHKLETEGKIKISKNVVFLTHRD
jgi:CRP/FNR family transcriptional regulator